MNGMKPFLTTISFSGQMQTILHSSENENVTHGQFSQPFHWWRAQPQRLVQAPDDAAIGGVQAAGNWAGHEYHAFQQPGVESTGMEHLVHTCRSMEKTDRLGHLWKCEKRPFMDLRWSFHALHFQFVQHGYTQAR